MYIVESESQPPTRGKVGQPTTCGELKSRQIHLFSPMHVHTAHVWFPLHFQCKPLHFGVFLRVLDTKQEI